jgi:chemotaxis protein MotB
MGSRNAPVHENHERRLVSYASTQSGKNRHKAVLPAGRVNQSKNHPPSPPPGPPHPAVLTKSLSAFQGGLDPEFKTGTVRLEFEGRGLEISMREAAFFSIIARIAVVIQGLPQPLCLGSYARSRPVHNARVRSNWELSAARASNDTDEGRAHNRRVGLVVLSAEAMKSEPGRLAAAPCAAGDPPSDAAMKEP